VTYSITFLLLLTDLTLSYLKIIDNTYLDIAAQIMKSIILPSIYIHFAFDIFGVIVTIESKDYESYEKKMTILTRYRNVSYLILVACQVTVTLRLYLDQILN
jgi:hypothetical protein